jgi:hypothetical protein
MSIQDRCAIVSMIALCALSMSAWLPHIKPAVECKPIVQYVYPRVGFDKLPEKVTL